MHAHRQKFVIALDQGTTSCRALAVGHDGRIASIAQEEITQFYPQPGWVEHDANEIWQTERRVFHEVVAQIGGPENVACVGITNQRETVVVWEKATGRPVHPAIVWQCRRSTDICERLKASGAEKMVREKTGLLLDPYFSATKLRWLFETFPALRTEAETGGLAFGTVDSWLLWCLSNEGKTGPPQHLTDSTNAARTLLYNIHTREWDDDLLRIFGVPRAMLPRIVPSSEVYFETVLDGVSVPVAGSAGDQQAALFGHGCMTPGEAKNTIGTGCFLLLNAGNTPPPPPPHGLLSTLAWEINGQATYALEGSIFAAGATVNWLRDGLGIIQNAHETESLARSVPNTNGVYFVPAFTGLGSPYWQPNARGMICGLTRGTTRAHIVRAALEAIAYQTCDIITAMQQATGLPLQSLRVDGGAARNDFLLQFQADLLGLPVLRAKKTEATALGAAYLAGLAVGFWDLSEIATLQAQAPTVFTPVMFAHERETLHRGWQSAVGYQVADG